MSEVTQLAESLHPHEVKVASALRASAQKEGLTEEDLAKATGLEVAQVSAALGRLQVKSLVAVLSETLRPIVSLTETGKHYFQHYAPMVRVMSALRAAAETGGQLAIKDIQKREGLDAGEISTAVGELKREGVLTIGAGGVVQTTSAASVTADSLQRLIRLVHEGPKPLSEFPPSDQALIEKFAQKRGKLIENEFWNMDALFMPQFHPARETHDVYFVKDPRSSAPIPEPFLSQVAAVHENGGHTGSSGWGYTFDRMRTRRLVLRSQGTAVSARTLAATPHVPGKYFSIARCFRYDQVDATHAPDFFQVEGIVLGPDINFRTLLGLLTLFAREMAQAQEIRFAPAYFPFTEPSVEVHARHPRLGWIELGGAGLFRPEVRLPLNVEVPVIAWGLGLDRMAMVALEIHDIRDLFSADLEMIRSKRVQY